MPDTTGKRKREDAAVRPSAMKKTASKATASGKQQKTAVVPPQKTKTAFKAKKAAKALKATAVAATNGDVDGSLSIQIVTGSYERVLSPQPKLCCPSHRRKSQRPARWERCLSLTQ